ncbi:MAG: hypothetical protein ACYCS1_04000 [Gammaproteobacteria bacterium]
MQTWITPQPLDSLIHTLIAALESASLVHTRPTELKDRNQEATPGMSRHHIFEILHPEWLHAVSEMDPRAGIGLPLRIHLYVLDGQTHLTYRTARESMEPFPSPRLASWARAIDHDLLEMLASIAQGI